MITPVAIERRIFTAKCPDCGKHSWFLAWFYEWYGWSITCLRCGRRWEGGEWMPLDFVRGSRQKSIARAKEHWRKGKMITEQQAKGREYSDEAYIRS